MVMMMGNAYGVTMQRVLGVVAAAMLATMNGAGAATKVREGNADHAAPLDITALLTAAHGAPPMICALASQAVRNYGWNDWTDAPVTPLSSVGSVRSRDIND